MDAAAQPYDGAMADARGLIERYYAHLTSGDLDGVLGMYSDDAEIVRYDGVAATPDELREYFAQHIVRNPGLRLNSIVRIREADDVLMWDALLDTDNGILQVVHVAILDEDGKFHRHIPGMRGYWGG